MRGLVSKAQEVGDLPQQFRPVQFINWALAQYIKVPEKLLALALERKLSIRWPSDNLDPAKQRYEASLAEAHGEIAALRQRNAELDIDASAQRALVGALQRQLDQLQKIACERSVVKSAPRGEAKVAQGSKSTSAKLTAKTKEYNTVCKILFGLVRRFYKLDLTKSNSVKLSEIVSDLALEGVEVDDETLRRHVRVGSEQSAR